MTIASRAPNEPPNGCPACGTALQVIPPPTCGEFPCPACGVPLWYAHLDGTTWLVDASRADRNQLLQLQRQIATSHFDSLDMVQLVMQLEELGHEPR